MIGLILLVVCLTIAGVGLYRAERMLWSRRDAAVDATARQLDEHDAPQLVERWAPASVAQPVRAASSEGDGQQTPTRVPVISGDGFGDGMSRTDVPETDHPVLVVDLDRTVRDRLKGILGDTHTVIEAGDASRALAFLERRSPSIILMGANVRDRNGRHLWQVVLRTEALRAIPLILVSALSTDEEIERYLERLPERPSAVLRKPLFLEDVRQTVQRLLDGQEIEAAFGHAGFGDGSSMALDHGWNRDEDERFVRRAQQEVERHMSDTSFGVRELSSELGLSARQLQRRLRDATGQSPNGFIRSIRLQRAAQMLERGSDAVSQVAYAVGFNSLSYFAKCFREHFGRNPSEFSTRRGRPVAGA